MQLRLPRRNCNDSGVLMDSGGGDSRSKLNAESIQNRSRNRSEIAHPDFPYYGRPPRISTKRRGYTRLASRVRFLRCARVRWRGRAGNPLLLRVCAFLCGSARARCISTAIHGVSPTRRLLSCIPPSLQSTRWEVRGKEGSRRVPGAAVRPTATRKMRAGGIQARSAQSSPTPPANEAPDSRRVQSRSTGQGRAGGRARAWVLDIIHKGPG
ncbi:hypothetical protein C8R46DRAFT_1147044 [Mycena filopes]|nr:hypothetical protein C8R46DRAFT_1147044 [Mycena filopes]